MSEGELPKAVATAGAAPVASSDDLLVAVKPRRAAAIVGALAAMFLLALVFVVTPPTAALRLLGGPKTELERYGGMRMVWEPPPGVDTRSLDTRLERVGSVYVLEAPHVREADV